MPSDSGEYDFDFIVIGSGFGGSVTAHRLVEKGYRVAVMEMGRRWTPETLAAHQLVHSSLVLASQSRVAGLLQHEIFQACHHSARLCSRRRIHHLRLYTPSTSRQSLGLRIVERFSGVEGGDAAALRDGLADAGRYGEQDPRTCGPSSEESRRRFRNRRNVLPDACGYLSSSRRRAWWPDLS